jgi:hypothetical protein
VLYEVNDLTTYKSGYVITVNSRSFHMDDIKSIIPNIQVAKRKAIRTKWNGNFDIGYHHQSGNVS